MSSVTDFFEEFSVGTGKRYNTSGENSDSVDGTGIDPSVNSDSYTKLYDSAVSLVNNCFPIIDFGCGIGWLEKKNEVYGFEGYEQLTKHMVGDKSRICIADFTRPIRDERLRKQFGLSCSFEVIEHIPVQSQYEFWKNAAFVSDLHYCSINVQLKRPREQPRKITKHHCTILNPKSWQGFFADVGISFKVCKNPVETLYPNKMLWKHSIFYLLDLRHFKPDLDGFKPTPRDGETYESDDHYGHAP